MIDLMAIRDDSKRELSLVVQTGQAGTGVILRDHRSVQRVYGPA